MITEKTPETWQDLQNWCADILRECDFQAETEKTVKLVRGKAEIDVFATETIEGRQYVTLIECKNWSSKVPQGVVHSFSTVVNGQGANCGYIVSKAGFQPGAYEAAENTNIQLVTWHEFQARFVEQWYWRHLTKCVVSQLEPLSSYIEPPPEMRLWDMYLEDDDLARLIYLHHQHAPLAALIMAMSPYTSIIIPQHRQRLELPLNVDLKRHISLPESIYTRTGYREFLVELNQHCSPLLAEFDSFRDKALARQTAGQKPLR